MGFVSKVKDVLFGPVVVDRIEAVKLHNYSETGIIEYHIDTESGITITLTKWHARIYGTDFPRKGQHIEYRKWNPVFITHVYNALP